MYQVPCGGNIYRRTYGAVVALNKWATPHRQIQYIWKQGGQNLSTVRPLKIRGSQCHRVSSVIQIDAHNIRHFQARRTMTTSSRISIFIGDWLVGHRRSGGCPNMKKQIARGRSTQIHPTPAGASARSPYRDKYKKYLVKLAVIYATQNRSRSGPSRNASLNEVYCCTYKTNQGWCG